MGEVYTLETGIVVAIVTTLGTIIVAIISRIGTKEKSAAKSKNTKDKNVEINQQSTGNGNTIIGLQITRKDDIDG